MRISNVLLAVFFVAACSGPIATTSQLEPASVSGKWLGTWNGGGGNHGSVYLFIEQTGPQIRGSIVAPGYAANSGEITGVVQGNEMTFTRSGSSSMSRMTVNGENMTGYSGAGSRLQLHREHP
jgi:hypothetical protein